MKVKIEAKLRDEVNQKENRAIEAEHLKNSKINKYILEDEIDALLNKLETTSIYVNRLDYYGNTIPLGAFCFAISFILYGFIECEILEKADTFTYLVLLLFGGVGQITAGVLEYIKARTFPTVCYLLYGIYFISFFLGYYYKDVALGLEKSRQIFYGTWAGLSLPLLIASLKTNVIYLLQNLSVFAFFIIRCIGECIGKNLGEKLKGLVSGILEMVTGFLSLYLCFSQLLNEHYRCNILPAFPISEENEIDVKVKK